MKSKKNNNQILKRKCNLQGENGLANSVLCQFSAKKRERVNTLAMERLYFLNYLALLNVWCSQLINSSIINIQRVNIKITILC